jgi:hypothetical protein
LREDYSVATIETTNWGDFYSPEEAIEVLRRNSNKPDLDIGYLRTLTSYGKFHPKKVGNVNMYPKHEVDAYRVEARGEKAGERFKQQAAMRKKAKRGRKAAS